MLRSSITMPERAYADLRKHLFPLKITSEQSAFIFARASKTSSLLQLNFEKWHPIQPDEYDVQSMGHIELKDEMRPKIIGEAFRSGTSIIEVHSHRYLAPARFSNSDLVGLEDFVPHVWWRLKGSPYAAMVFSPKDFDALVWIEDSRMPQQLSELRIGEKRLRPNGLSVMRRGKEHGRYTI